MVVFAVKVIFPPTLDHWARLKNEKFVESTSIKLSFVCEPLRPDIVNVEYWEMVYRDLKVTVILFRADANGMLCTIKARSNLGKTIVRAFVPLRTPKMLPFCMDITTGEINPLNGPAFKEA